MECSRCCLQPVLHAFTQSNLDNSLGRMKTKEIIAAVNNLKVVFKNVCTKCHALPEGETNTLLADLQETWNTKFAALMQSMHKDAEAMSPIIEDLRHAFQAVCLTCAKVSNDDNPSNHGQSFVSLDSGSCQTNSGLAKSSHTDDNVVMSRADWIGLHRAADVDDRVFGVAPDVNVMMKEDPEEFKRQTDQSTSLLPPEIEDTLRKEFSNFVELDIIDKLLLSCIMSGMNIAEFAKMLWFPYSIVDPKTRTVKSITKQAAHARWVNICKRFPVFMSVAISSNKDNERAMKRLQKFIADPNGGESDMRFQNGKMSAVYARAAKKAKEEAERKKELLRKKQQEEEQRKQAEKANGRRGKKKVKSLDNTDCLPGLF